MSNGLRQIKRNKLKQEMGSNNINEEYHKRYGYTRNITKKELTLMEKIKKKIDKLKRKSRKARKNKEVIK
jgi:hypothetical protein